MILNHLREKDGELPRLANSHMPQQKVNSTSGVLEAVKAGINHLLTAKVLGIDAAGSGLLRDDRAYSET